MPLLINSIAGIQFWTLRGVPNTFAQQIQVMIRPGVNFESLRRTGIRGRLFQLQTIVDEQSHQTGENAIIAYKALAGNQFPQQVIKNNVDWGFYNILDVQGDVIAAITSHVGAPISGLNPQVRVIARWTLLHRTNVNPNP